MNFDSILFLGFSFVAVMAIRFCAPGRLRDAIICVANILFILGCAKDIPPNLPGFQSFVALKLSSPVILFVVMGYFAVYAAGRMHSTRGALPILILFVITIFVWFKRYSLISFVPTLFGNIFTTIGLSYILFRILHLVIDVAQGSIRTPGFMSYLSYSTFFLNFVSGPIQRYPDFAEQSARRPAPLKYQEVYASIGRVIVGYFLIIPVSVATSALSKKFTLLFYDAVNTNGIMSYDVWGVLAIAAAVQLVNLFVNFSGYMHIVIGIGRLAGFHLPENFNHPFRSENFLDFWARWHITLSDWFKFYLFNPFLKVLVNKWGNPKSTPYLGAVAFFVTFLIIGVWHGTSLNFVFVGILFGLGVSINKIWQIEISKRLGKNRYKELCLRQWYKNISRSMALSYFSMVFALYWLTPKMIPHVTMVGFIEIGILAFLVLFSAGALTLSASDYIKSYVHLIFPTGLKKILPATTEWSELQLAAWTCIKLFAIANFAAFLSGSVPDFIYKAY